MILIPKEKLQEGFEQCYNHVALLLSDSKKLYDERRFVSSISLAILAYEEIGKLELIRIHLYEKSDITEEQWKELSAFGSHFFKLLTFYQRALDAIKRLGKEGYDRIVEDEKKRGSQVKFKTFEEIINNEATFKTSIKKFNSVKKSCFYLDWKNNDWFSITSFYTEHELELLANFLQDFTMFGLLTERLDYKYPSNFFHQIPDEISIMKKDEIWIEREKYASAIYTEEYQKFLAAINYLIDKFPH